MKLLGKSKDNKIYYMHENYLHERFEMAPLCLLTRALIPLKNVLALSPAPYAIKYTKGA